MDKDKHSCKNPDVCNRFKQGQQAHCCDKGENKCQRPESCPRKKKYPNDPCCQSEKSTQVHEAEVVDLEAGCPNTCPRRQKYPNDPCCKGKVESICPETCPRKNKYPKTPCCESKVSASMKDECSRPGICAHKTKYPREPCCVQPADGRTPPKKEDSTQVLYMMPNFEPTPSEQDKFYDCISESDVPDEGSTKSTRTSFDDPQAMRVALQRASDAAQKLLKNFDSCKDVARSQYDEPQVCSANLEISAKLTSLSGSQENDIRCNPYTVRIDPITFKIPITFNVPAGVCPCQTSLNEPLLTATVARPQLAYSTGDRCDNTKSQQTYLSALNKKQTHYITSTCQTSSYRVDTANKSKRCPCPTSQCRLDCPFKASLTRDILKIQIIREKTPLQDEEILSIKTEKQIIETESPIEIFIKEPVEEPSDHEQRYFIALPQHKDFESCRPCRYDPSPLIDSDGNVFCPGNCGCCLCAWKNRVHDYNREHLNVKVCKCINRGTIFNDFHSDSRPCSQTSYFDFCPCREKAEAKFLEHYDCEMWSPKAIRRGQEVTLKDIKQIKASRSGLN